MAATTLARYSPCFLWLIPSFCYKTGLIWSRLNYWYPWLTLESSAHRVLRPLKLPILSSSYYYSSSFFWSFVKPRALTMTFTGTKTTPIWSTRSCASSFVLLKSFWNTFCHTITKEKQVHSIADLAFLFVAKRSPRNFRSKFNLLTRHFSEQAKGRGWFL